MSLSLNGEKCVICKAYLFEEDDTVYCPECGAPHHRECYNSVGHCGLREFHGSENQYVRPEQNKEEKSECVNDEQLICNVCGYSYKKDDQFCPNCKAPNISDSGTKFVTFDFSTDAPSHFDLGSGVTVAEAKKFVLNNSHRYISKFIRFKNGEKASWNWLAFLTPCGWLMSRKMYLLGGIIGAVQIALAMINFPFINVLNQLGLSECRTYAEISNLVLENISVIGIPVILTSFISGILDIVIRIVFAIFGDLIYRKKVITNIVAIKQNELNKEELFAKKGGVNLWMAILGYFCVSELPAILATFLGILR